MFSNHVIMTVHFRRTINDEWRLFLTTGIWPGLTTVQRVQSELIEAAGRND